MEFLAKMEKMLNEFVGQAAAKLLWCESLRPISDPLTACKQSLNS